MPKMTEWFDGAKFVPGSVGVYQRDCPGSTQACYSWWGGTFWSPGDYSPDFAFRFRGLVSLSQNLPFRGLAREPKP